MSNPAISELFKEDMPIDDYLSRTQKERNDKGEKYLIKQLTSSRCALCLGAGVTKGIGMPLWPELITNLFYGLLVHFSFGNDAQMEHLVHSDIDQRMRDIELFKSVSSLEAAEYIQLSLEQYAKYRAHKNNFRYEQKTAERFLARDILSTLEFLKNNCKSPDWSVVDELAKLITAEKGIRHVINYNYDDALECACERIGADMNRIVSCGLSECTARTSSGQLPSYIYHIHGRLPLFSKVLEEHVQKDINAGVILSERSYNQTESMIYNSTNTCQAQIFQTHSCLFIGFSAQDYNYKRIVKGMPLTIEDKEKLVKDLDSGKEPVIAPHFILFSINSFIKELKAHDSKKHEKVILTSEEESYKYFLQRMIETHFNYYTRFNVWPIYIRDHHAVQPFIRKLNDSISS